MRIGIIAGELSGDVLGAGLIQALRQHYPQATFEGIGGSAMQAQGLTSHFPLETLAVMGLFEVIRHYPRLRRCYQRITQYFLDQPPDVFIGIDAPDFNLRVEARLHAAGIPTVHYVSPSVWAWRQYRVKRIAKSCDLMLTLLPFEAKFYEQHGVPVQFVGHPLADSIVVERESTTPARHQLGLDSNRAVIAILPGSRQTELRQLGELFLQTAQQLYLRYPDVHFLVPTASPKIAALFAQQQAAYPDLPLTVLDGQAQLAMRAADVVLLASGTATLEALLLKRPMVVAYRFTPLTYWLGRYLVNVAYFALPNLLANRALVPEFLQHAATPETLTAAVAQYLDNPNDVTDLCQTFTDIHQGLRHNASQQAAQAIATLLAR